MNAERYITPELKDYEEQILGAQEKIEAIQARLYSELVEAASFISTMKVDSPSDMLSLAPTRVKILSTTPMRALWAATKHAGKDRGNPSPAILRTCRSGGAVHTGAAAQCIANGRSTMAHAIDMPS